jgi:hypothetical protein
MDRFENEKELISIWKKKNRLMQGKRALNLVELPKPERWGYKRFFVLREDVAKSREAAFFQGILKLIQSTIISRDKKFEYKDYKTKTKKPIMQYVKDIDLRSWNKLIAEGKLTDKQQSFFERKWKNNPGNKGGYWVYEFKKPWVFELRKQPHYITHRILLDPKLESELTELENRIDRQNLLPKISKIMGWKYGWRDFYDRKKMIIENATDKLLKEELDGFTARYDD